MTTSPEPERTPLPGSFGEEVTLRPGGCPHCRADFITIYAAKCWRCEGTFAPTDDLRPGTSVQKVSESGVQNRDQSVELTATERAGIRSLVSDDRAGIDHVRTLLKGALGSVPVAGSALSAALELAWRPQFEKRTNALLEMILEDLVTVGNRVGNIESAIDRIQEPLVISGGITAIYAASRSYDEEKVRYLATGVARLLRNDLPWSADADLTLALLRLIDDLTTGQLQILEFMARPPEWARRRNRAINYHPNDAGRYLLHPMLMATFPELRGKESSLIAIVAGLESRGLVNVVGFNDPDASFPDLNEFERGITSHLGDELMRFLRLPTSIEE